MRGCIPRPSKWTWRASKEGVPAVVDDSSSVLAVAGELREELYARLWKAEEVSGGVGGWVRGERECVYVYVCM